MVRVDGVCMALELERAGVASVRERIVASAVANWQHGVPSACTPQSCTTRRLGVDSSALFSLAAIAMTTPSAMAALIKGLVYVCFARFSLSQTSKRRRQCAR
jgi:hypothetical protein